MKKILFLLSVGLLLLSCIKDHPSPQVLKTSEKKLHFSGNGGVWQLTVNSNAGWQVSGTTDWCQTSKTDGYNTDYIAVTVTPNDTQEKRSTTLTLQSERVQTQVLIEQDTLSGEYHYRLPVIFHIFYADATDTLQNIKTNVIEKLITECNEAYREHPGSVGMNLELVAATEDPDGNPLDVPGINRILKSTAAYQSCQTFMQNENKTNAALIWNPNQYINVFIYQFTENNTLGISHLPYTPRENSLAGLQASNIYYTRLPAYPHSISLNSTYLYEETAYKTLVHELGHYLGLHHVFSEKDCEETDYCDDTPSYNREEYLSWLQENQEISFLQKCQRNGCESGTFISRNYMDYDYSYLELFTPDQFLRVRHVLENSPLLPGPKNILVTKVACEETIPPIRTME